MIQVKFILGVLAGYVASNEFQKRVAPHLPSVLFLVHEPSLSDLEKTLTSQNHAANGLWLIHLIMDLVWDHLQLLWSIPYLLRLYIKVYFLNPLLLRWPLLLRYLVNDTIELHTNVDPVQYWNFEKAKIEVDAVVHRLQVFFIFFHEHVV